MLYLMNTISILYTDNGRLRNFGSTPDAVARCCVLGKGT